MNRISVLSVIAALVFSCSGEPKISVEPEIHNAGDMAPKERRVIWFVLSNPGDAELVIENVRPLCDCITVDSIPESIAPAEKDSLRVTYISPDSAGPDESSLVIRTNAEPKNKKLVIRSSVLDVKLTPADSTICILPFQPSGLPDGMQYSLKLYHETVKNLPPGYPAINPNELTARIQADPNYRVEPLHDIARKWGNLLGIRFTVVGEVKSSATGDGIDVSIMIIDGFFHLPVGRRIIGIPEQEVASAVSDTLRNMLENIGEYEKQVLMLDLQRQWMEQRAELLGRPAPNIVAEDVRTGESLSLEDFRGKPLIVQFFSTDCRSCKDEMDWVTGLVKRHPEIAALGISVNVGEIDSVVAYIKEADPPYPIILPKEENEEQLDSYNNGATPQTVIISPDGKVVESLVGFSHKAMDGLEKLLLEMVGTSNTATNKNE
ncbi:hypothetical protein DRQ36_08840 [bacterium]|nr:MAG: hypothetical protein DRQ36_08840 [bacterium]